MANSKSVTQRIRELKEIIRRAESRIKACKDPVENKIDRNIIQNAERTINELSRVMAA